jgi:hypothetical protein
MRSGIATAPQKGSRCVGFSSSLRNVLVIHDIEEVLSSLGEGLLWPDILIPLNPAARR